MAKRILLADGDDLHRAMLARAFSDEGYVVTEARTGTEAVEAARRDRPNAVILEVVLADLGGLDVIRALREEMTCPILVVSAKNEESDRLVGLYVGADDYVGKPVSAREVVARVAAQLRRVDALAPSRPMLRITEIGGVHLNHDARRAYVDGVEVLLTAREFDLLNFLLEHAGRAQSSQVLIEEVWGEAFTGARDGNTLKVHIYYLRDKLGRCPTAPIRITTVPGAGYRLDVLTDDAAKSGGRAEGSVTA